MTHLTRGFTAPLAATGPIDCGAAPGSVEPGGPPAVDHEADYTIAEVGATCATCSRTPLGAACLGCSEHYCGDHDPHGVSAA
jgi:hypothetical protein